MASTEKRPRPLALAYIRVSTAGQAEEGASLAGQRQQLIDEASRRGWDVRVVEEAGESAKDLARPALQEALTLLDKGAADYLLAIRHDRVSRSVSDFSGLMDRAEKRGWEIKLLNGPATTGPDGRFTSHILAAAAQYERELISIRTKEGMAQRAAEGVKMGRPRTLSEETEVHIHRLKDQGHSLRGIAQALNAEGIPTATGKTWHASTIRQVLTRAA